MAKSLNRDMSIDEAAQSFLLSLSPEQRKEYQQEVNRFVEWNGRGRLIHELTAPEVGSYAEWIMSSTNISAVKNGAAQKLIPVRAFLTYAKKERLVPISLSSHLGVKKGPSKRKSPSLNKQEREKRTTLTAQAYEQLKAQISTLEKERPRIAEEIRRAAADKDFSENAPLEAAREEHEQIEAQIKELRSMLQLAMVADEKEEVDSLRVNMGSRVAVRRADIDEKLSYILVSPNELNVVEGKISTASPVGRALLHREVGDSIEVVTPSGKLYYQIIGIEPENSMRGGTS